MNYMDSQGPVSGKGDVALAAFKLCKGRTSEERQRMAAAGFTAGAN